MTFSHARSHEKLDALAREAGASAGTPRAAAESADAILLAVHWSRLEDVLEQAGELEGKVVVSCSLPMNADDSELLIAHSSWSASKRPSDRRGHGVDESSTTFRVVSDSYVWHAGCCVLEYHPTRRERS